jgi:spermidine synthase
MIWFPRGLSFVAGFLSLSLEILWVRLVGLVYRGAPQSFGLVLGLYLVGIAIGAYYGKRACSRSGDLYGVSAAVLVVAGLFDLAAPFLYSASLELERQNALFILAPIVALVAAFKSVVFPIAHHLGTRLSAGQLGRSVSKVYFCNILGSTAGPLVTGFVLLQYLSLQQCFEAMSATCIALALCCALLSPALRSRLQIPAGIALLAVAVAAAVLPDTLTRGILTRTRDEGGVVGRVIENRQGVIHTVVRQGESDAIYGGNAYDGRVSTQLTHSANRIERVYLALALHPVPKRILSIGMSVGSWAQVLAGNPGLEHLDIVEINPAYLGLAASYPETQSILRQPKVSIHIDDGRRWLKLHPDETYDVVIMNSTYHWRAYSTLLLSVEFMQDIRRHMRPGAVLAFNTTVAPSAYRTAREIFPHVYKYFNFAYASDIDLEPAVHRAVDAMLDVHIGDYTPRQHDPAELQELQNKFDQEFGTFESTVAADSLRTNKPLGVISDQNLLTEYREGQSIHGFLRWPR